MGVLQGTAWYGWLLLVTVGTGEYWVVLGSTGGLIGVLGGTWGTREYWRILCYSVEYCGVLQGNAGHCWVLPGTTGYWGYWVHT